ncbi:MAG: Txe/YoeB family addiction module toxin [Actinomycetaceae bacterium]|nr:Txe/YoeB family addiction module toxin [Actinomycetaceae bacterium]
MRKLWSEKAWEDYLYWQNEDRRILKRINALIKSLERNPEGITIGKPERLKYSQSGLLSVRIDQSHRLVYKFHVQDGEQVLLIISCRGHYQD